MTLLGYIIFVLSFVFVSPFLSPIMAFLGSLLAFLTVPLLSPVGRLFPRMGNLTTFVGELFAAVASGVVIAASYLLWARLAVRVFHVSAVVLLSMSVLHLGIIGAFSEAFDPAPLKEGFFGTANFTRAVVAAAILSALVLYVRIM